MAKDVKITPTSGYIQFLDTNGDNYAILSGDATNDEGRITLGMPASGVQILDNAVSDSVFSVFGDEGTLFNVSDDLSDSLMSVNDAAGLPVFEVFADDVVIAGEYNQNDLVVSGNNVGVGTPIPDTKLHVAGKIKVATLDTDATLTDFVVVDGAGEMHKRTSGAKGAQGSQGSQGAKGATGSQGAKGDKGQKGATGSQGSQGGTGAKGATGSQGAKGDKGQKGQKGATGSQGNQGAKGATGSQGSQGGTGAKGQKGSPASIANDSNNRVITADGDGSVTAEANLTFDGSTLTVTGHLAATTKSFLIDHPTKENKQLRYASLEGPEHAVYVRGRSQEDVVELPDYWTGLVDKNSTTVTLTPIGSHQDLYVSRIENNKVYISSGDEETTSLIEKDYFYVIYAERIDVDKLQVEIG